MRKTKPIAKKESAEHLLNQIKESTVFGKKLQVQALRCVQPEPYRSDSDAPVIPSSTSRKVNTFAVEPKQYSGAQELSIGLGYNKGGLQVLMKKELRDAGKKTSQLED